MQLARRHQLLTVISFDLAQRVLLLVTVAVLRCCSPASPNMASLADLQISSLYSFKQHVVLVTGGATGLGEMAASGFVANGARVIIASRKEPELQKTTDRINKEFGGGDGKCEYVVADLKDKKGCDALIAEVKKRTDRLTVLLNNSGITWGAPYDDFPESGWE